MTTIQKARNVLLALLYCYLIWTVVCIALYFLGPEYLFHKDPMELLIPVAIHKITLQEITTDCLVAPMWEELWWRACLLYILSKIISKDVFSSVKIPLCLFLGIWFGLWHGHVQNVFCQGIMGFFLNYLYLKNKNSYWSAVAMHSGWNLAITLDIPTFYTFVSIY